MIFSGKKDLTLYKSPIDDETSLQYSFKNALKGRLAFKVIHNCFSFRAKVYLPIRIGFNKNFFNRKLLYNNFYGNLL